MHPHTVHLHHSTYIPIIGVFRVTVRQTVSRLWIATLDEPERVCGFARRIGYTGTRIYDLTVYRLKIKRENTKMFMTLPELFVIDEGVFVEYEQWLQQQEQGKNFTDSMEVN